VDRLAISGRSAEGDFTPVARISDATNEGVRRQVTGRPNVAKGETVHECIPGMAMDRPFHGVATILIVIVGV